MKVRFWGTRGSIPVPGKDTINYGGNTTCAEITLESGRRVIIDSGTGIRALGDHLSSEEKAVDIHLLITHIHWDHVAGFPFFAPIHDPATKISVDGFPTCMKGLKIPFDNKMSNGFFPVKFDDLKAEINYLDKLNSGPLEVDGVVIDSIALRHPQGGFGFRFRDGKKTFVFLTDNELRKEMLGGNHAVDYVSFCKDADLLVHDAQYTPEEIDERRGWGHSDYVSALNLASEAHAKRLILFHHDPSRKDPEIASIVAQCQELAGRNNDGIVIDAAKEGTELTC
jgi:phosphoribosyl 1,2-cyclic phosphodiesterase